MPDHQLVCAHGSPTHPQPLLFLVFLRVTFLKGSQTSSHSLPGKLYLGEGEQKKEIKAWVLEGQPKSTAVNASAACFK